MKFESNEASSTQTISIADTVVKQLREEIIRGRFQPGKKISETFLASFFGVSRSPIREALLSLEMDGFIVSSSNRSSFVWEPSETDIIEIYSIRSVIETLAGELIIQKLKEEDYKNLEVIISFEKEMIRANDFYQLIQADKKFHEYIVNLTGYNRLIKTWRKIMGQWEMISYLRFQNSPKTVPPYGRRRSPCYNTSLEKSGWCFIEAS